MVKPTGVVNPPPRTQRRSGPMQNIFEGVADAEDGEFLDVWREGGSGLPSAEDVAAGADAGVDAAGVEEASQVQGKTTEVAEGREVVRHLCVPCGRAPGGGATPSDPPEHEGGATPSDPPEHEEGASTPVRSAAAGAPDSEDDNDMDICEDDNDMYLEDEENASEEEQQRKLEVARASYSEAINTLRKAYANAQEFIDRLNEIGFATEGLLQEGEVASAMDAEVTSTVIVQ